MTNNSGIEKTIQPIFSPAISVLNRMGYTRKFTLLWLMSLVAIAVVTYSLFSSLDRVIQPSQRELQGLLLIEPVFRTVQVIQLHRGLSTALLGGNETIRERRAAKGREAAEVFNAMEGKLPPRLTSSENFLRIKVDWEKLRKEGPHWTVDENFAAHTRLIEQLQSFEVSVADDYALILDAELDTYYLIDTNVNKLPHVLEYLGQLRAYGTGILARKQITERQKIKLNNLIALLDSALNELSISIEKTGRYSPAVRKSLLAAYDGIADSARQITGLVAADIFAGHFATPPDVFLDMATAEIDKGYAQMYQALLPTTKALIEERIARAENTLLMTVSSALLLFLLAVYFSVAMYYAIVGSIRSLVRSAHTFAEGDLSVRVKLNTRDELSRIGDSFNKMADGFSALLEARTQAVHDLYESEKLYHSLFENMLNGFAYCQMLFEQGQPQDFIFISVNAAFEAQTGLKNAVGKRVSEVVPGIRQSDPELFEALGRVSLSGKPERLEIYLNVMQQWFWMSVYSPENGYFVAVFDVVTERKRAEEDLRKSKDLLLSVVENAPVRIFWKDRDSRYLGCNTHFAKDAGYFSPDELTGKTDFDMGWKDQAELYRADDEEVMNSGNAKLDFEEPQTTPDGNMIWARTSKVPLRDESNRVIGILGIYQDITERKKAEEVLAESEEKYRSIYENTQVGLYRTRISDGKLMMANDAMAKMFGFDSVEEATAKYNTSEHYVDPGTRERLLGAIRTYGKFDNFEARLTRNDGIARWFQYSGRLVQNKGYIEGVATDITDHKQAEAAVQHANRALATLGAVNRNLVHATNEDELLQAICQAIVRQRGYRLAWVGYVQHDESKSIKIMAHAGHDEGYLDATQITWAENERGKGPTGRAIRSGATQLCQDIANDPLNLPWRDAELQRGYAASIALPLLNRDSTVFGTLTVYAEEVNAFSPGEISLLEEMAGDLAFGVRTLHTRQQRDNALVKNQEQLVQLHKSLEDTVRAMAAIVEMRDPYTAGHQARVADLATAIAKQIGLPEEQVHGIHLAGTVHDLGKINVPAEILSKPGKITDIERSLIKIHPQAGYDILKGIDFPWPIAQMVLQHHERFDGSGYPQGLKGDQIIIEARILCVADVVEAMSSHRPYRPGLGIETAIEDITRQRGIYYDPQAVDACLALFREQGYRFK